MAKSLRPPAQGNHSQLTSRLGYQLPERIIGIHLNMLAVRRDLKMLENPTAEEKTFLGELNHFLKEETGYQWIQGTKPTTLAFELTDSSVGLAAWIVEKFHSWTDNEGSIETAVSRDELLTHITLYRATGAIGSSFWPYYARAHSPWPIPQGTASRGNVVRFCGRGNHVRTRGLPGGGRSPAKRVSCGPFTCSWPQKQGESPDFTCSMLRARVDFAVF